MSYKWCIALGVCAASLSAVETSGEGLGLEALLDDATQVVASSKLNLDYTPSVVSVVEYDQMRLLGVKTLFEALALLPGVETSVNQLGVKKVVFRGFDTPNNFVFDKAKLLIDGVAIEMGMYGNSSFYYDFPVDLIERIEVLRGPGSALYGTGAFNGVINVITRQDLRSDHVIFASMGSHKYLMGGTHMSYYLGEGDHLDIDAYYQKHDRQIYAGRGYTVGDLLDFEETLATGTPVIEPITGSYSSNEGLQDYSVGVTYTTGPWSFRTRVKNDTNGNYFGWDERLETSDRYDNVQRFIFAELAYKDRISSTQTVDVRVGYSRYDLDLEAQNFVQLFGTAVPYEFTITDAEDKRWLEASVTSTAYDGHMLSFGASYKRMLGLNNTLDDTISPYGERNLFENDQRRNTYSLFARDTVKLDEDLYGLLALRGDYYTENDITYPSVQVGMVYFLDDQWHLKFNYGHAYRMPSWVELYTVEYGPDDGSRPGNPDLDAEMTDTVELVAIWRQGQTHHLQANVYYSMLRDVIDISEEDMLIGYTNQDPRCSAGMELAYTYTTPDQSEAHINFSYNQTNYVGPINQQEQSMPGVAKAMVKGYYIHYLTPSTTLSTLVKYIGERTRNEDFDHRPNGYDRGYDAYTTVDLTLTTKRQNNWEFSASVKNLFDETIFYPSYFATHTDGIPRDGRNYLVQVKHLF